MVCVTELELESVLVLVDVGLILALLVGVIVCDIDIVVLGDIDSVGAVDGDGVTVWLGVGVEVGVGAAVVDIVGELEFDRDTVLVIVLVDELVEEVVCEPVFVTEAVLLGDSLELDVVEIDSVDVIVDVVIEFVIVGALVCVKLLDNVGECELVGAGVLAGEVVIVMELVVVEEEVAEGVIVEVFLGVLPVVEVTVDVIEDFGE